MKKSSSDDRFIPRYNVKNFTSTNNYTLNTSPYYESGIEREYLPRHPNSYHQEDIYLPNSSANYYSQSYNHGIYFNNSSSINQMPFVQNHSKEENSNLQNFSDQVSTIPMSSSFMRRLDKVKEDNFFNINYSQSSFNTKNTSRMYSDKVYPSRHDNYCGRNYEDKGVKKIQRGPIISENKKTELCKNWVAGVPCKYGEGCVFAHGYNELRSMTLQEMEKVGRIPKAGKFRSFPCITYVAVGACPYRDRCVFIHPPMISSNFESYIPAKPNNDGFNGKREEKDVFFWPDREVFHHNESLFNHEGASSVSYRLPESYYKSNNFLEQQIVEVWENFERHMNDLKDDANKDSNLFHDFQTLYKYNFKNLPIFQNLILPSLTEKLPLLQEIEATNINSSTCHSLYNRNLLNPLTTSNDQLNQNVHSKNPFISSNAIADFVHSTNKPENWILSDTNGEKQTHNHFLGTPILRHTEALFPQGNEETPSFVQSNPFASIVQDRSFTLEHFESRITPNLFEERITVSEKANHNLNQNSSIDSTLTPSLFYENLSTMRDSDTLTPRLSSFSPLSRGNIDPVNVIVKRKTLNKDIGERHNALLYSNMTENSTSVDSKEAYPSSIPPFELPPLAAKFSEPKTSMSLLSLEEESKEKGRYPSALDVLKSERK